MAKITMGDPYLQGRGDEIVMLQNYGFKAVRLRDMIADVSGVREAPLGQPKPRSMGCTNCGAPWEAVCSYCGTVA